MFCEVVVYNMESALKAQEGGADRIELCDNPGVGGTTPSYAMIEQVRQNISMDVYVMLRPRGGDFLYSNYEFHIMKRDLYQCQKLSVDGVVFGILNTDGTIDKKRCAELIRIAKPLKVTCHRAFDMTRDPFEALEDCIEVGFDRILTSGQCATAIEGAELIRQMKSKAGDRIKIMAGSGVRANNVKQLIETTRVDEIHFSAASVRPSNMSFVNTKISGMGSGSGSEYVVRTVDPEMVRSIRSLGESVVI
ncbi:MAG: copper homeostasis protein CutC [Cyclobacteriaceae bacterium]